MKTIRTKVYQFSELSEQAKQTAIEEFRYNDEEFISADEVLDSIKDGLNHFGAKLKDYSIDWGNVNRSSFEIDMQRDEEVEELSGVRLFKYLNNNNLLTYWCKYDNKAKKLLDGDCPFTGVCYDENFLDNIRTFVKNPDSTTFKELLNDSVYNTIKSGCNEYEYEYSDKGITERIGENEYYFTKEGKMFNS